MPIIEEFNIDQTKNNADMAGKSTDQTERLRIKKFCTKVLYLWDARTEKFVPTGVITMKG